jgi:hypothetical protein
MPPHNGDIAISVYALIRRAVIAKKVVRARYNGRVRLMCPHCLGAKGGKDRLYSTSSAVAATRNSALMALR